MSISNTMHNPNSGRKAFLPELTLGLAMLLAASAPAATITWDAPQNISGTADVNTNGTQFGSWAPGDGSASSYPVNGVVFPGTDTLGLTTSGFSGASAAFPGHTTPDANYNYLLQYGQYASGTTASFIINGKGTKPLTVGRQYLVQFWVSDPRSYGVGRSETVSGSSAVGYHMTSGMGQHVVGRFTADADFQQVDLSASVSAQVNLLQVRDVTPALPDAGTSTVTVSLRSIAADGVSSSIITVTLLDSFSFPLAGKTVTLAQTSGPGTATVAPLSAVSDANGRVTFTVRSSTPGTDVFTATDSTDALVLTQTATVNFLAGSVANGANSTVVATPTAVVTDGISTSTVVVSLKDGFNQPVVGKTVTLTQTSGPGWPMITPASDTSDANGQTTFTVSCVSAGPAVLAATDLTDDNLPITQTATVTFLDPPSISGDPMDLTTYAGNSAKFTVAASGSMLSYQWYFNTNTPVAAGTNATLVLTNVQSGGAYCVVVTNAVGSVTSSVAILSVQPNLVVNGDFENPLLTSSYRSYLPGDSTSLAAWAVDTVPANGVQLARAGVFTANNGSQNLQLTGGNGSYSAPGGISQTLATIPGASYWVSIDVATRSATAEAPGNLRFGATNFVLETSGAAFVTRSWLAPATSTNSVIDITGYTNSSTAQTIIDNLIVTLAEAGPVDASASTLTAAPLVQAADGVSTATLTVTLRDANGVPVTNKTVSVAQSSGSGTAVITPLSPTTGIPGQATFAVKTTTPGTYSFTAFDATDGLTVTQTATVSFLAGSLADANNSAVSASPASVMANGSASSTLTVTLKDGASQPVSGKLVTLAQTSGQGTPIITTLSGTSDANGRATFTVTSTTAGVATFAATDVTDGNIILAQTATVTFTAPTWVWINPAGGSWDIPANWLNGGISDGTSTADFSTLNLTADVTVSLNSPRTNGNLVFGDTGPSSAAGWTLDNAGMPGNTLTLAGDQPAITVNALAPGKSVTIAATLAGSAGLLKAGVGTLALATTNLYTGATVISNGTVSLTALSASATTGAPAKELANSPITINPGATLLAGATTAGYNAHNVSKGITLNGGILASNGVAGNNDGNFALDNTGGKIVAGSNTVSTISAVLGLNGTHEFNVADGGTLFISGRVANWEGQTWGFINKTGPGTLVLTSSGNSYGSLTLRGGTVSTEGAALAGGNGYRADFETNATLQWRPGNTTDYSASGKIKIADGVTATFDTGTNKVTLATALALGSAKTAALVKTGSGTLVLSAVNTFSGPTTVNNGKLLGVTGSSCSNSPLTVQASGSGATATFGVTYNGTNAQWSCSNLTTLAALSGGNAPGLEFNFNAAPSTTTAPLKVVNRAAFDPATTLTVNSTNLAVGSRYPLLVAGGTVSGLPTLTPLGPSLSGSLAWGDGAGFSSQTLVLTVSSPVTTPTPTNITCTISGRSLVLSWPNGVGWVLEAQTNRLQVGLTTNWVRLRAATSPLTNVVDPANGAIFYRLVQP